MYIKNNHELRSSCRLFVPDSHAVNFKITRVHVQNVPIFIVQEIDTIVVEDRR